MNEGSTSQSHSIKMGLAWLFLIVAIILGVAFIMGSWKTEVEPTWATLCGQVFWPILLISIALFVWVKKSKR